MTCLLLKIFHLQNWMLMRTNRHGAGDAIDISHVLVLDLLNRIVYETREVESRPTLARTKN